MPRISRSFIAERLLPAVSIEKLIGSYLPLKRSGSNYMCCCPFHHEKTPSFSVTPSKNMFYCFGCHEHGDALGFLMKYKNLSFVDAVEDLAAFAGMPVEYEEGGSPDRADAYRGMYELMDRVASAFTRVLFDPRGQAGFDYFTKKRGLSRDTLISSRLGFAPEGWHFLEEEVCRSEDEKRLLSSLGMIVSRDDGKRFDMYRNRVMIPIFDRKGRVISFGGRTMGDDKPKYMNTKETPIFRKRNELFGLYECLKASRNRPERIVVVEGYMDVISVRQAGISYAVASLGTATTPEQFKLMFRYTNKVICCYDGDSAGRAAAWHALDTITPVLSDDTEVRFAFLPPEDDPDSLVRTQGPGAFIRFLDAAQSYPEFLVSHIEKQHNLNDPGDRARFFAEAAQKIRAIPLKALQEVTAEVLAERHKLTVERVHEMVGSAPAERGEPELAEAEEQSDRGILSTPMRRLISFALQYPLIVAQAYQNFRLEDFLNLCERLKVRGTSEAQRLLGSISEINETQVAGTPGGDRTARLSTAVLLAREENEKVRHYYDLLAGADLGVQCRDGKDALSRRAQYLAELLPEVLARALRERAALLSGSGGSVSESALAEAAAISRGLMDRGLQTS
ncbi:MAG: DNA primase [Succinivibrio sp.]|jgi:DNA primase|nr:DNA primase [Succinivibrio sp.]